VIICLDQGADLHMAQLMPLPLTVSCFSKIQIGFTFMVPAHLGNSGQSAVKRVHVCVCVCLLPGRFPTDGNQVAPGMSCLYSVRFLPDALCDYDDELIVECLATPLTVPIHARRLPPLLTCELLYLTLPLLLLLTRELPYLTLTPTHS